MKETRKGVRVAHKELDDLEGGARQGVVEDVLGEEPSLVVIRHGQEKEAYDSRELIFLSGIPGIVILHPRHALRLLKTSAARMAVAVDIALLALFVVAAFIWGWAVESLVLLGVLIAAVAFVVILMLERDALRQSGLPR